MEDTGSRSAGEPVAATDAPDDRRWEHLLHALDVANDTHPHRRHAAAGARRSGPVPEDPAVPAPSITLDLPQDAAVEAVTAALAAQGFGVLTTIDVRATLKAKLGADVEDFTILGACNPALAHQALSADPAIGLLLPCNVTVRRADGRTLVQAVDPAELLAMAGDGDPRSSELADVARDASRRLRGALASLSTAVPPDAPPPAG